MKELELSHIVLDELEVGTHHFPFRLDNAFFQAVSPSELLGGEVDVKAQIDMSDDAFSLHFTIQGVVQVACDRCLDPMDISISLDEDTEPDEDNPRVLDLTWLAYEMIVTSLPPVHCHQEGGCNPEMIALLQNHLCTDPDEEQDSGSQID